MELWCEARILSKHTTQSYQPAKSWCMFLYLFCIYASVARSRPHLKCWDSGWGQLEDLATSGSSLQCWKIKHETSDEKVRVEDKTNIGKVTQPPGSSVS